MNSNRLKQIIRNNLGHRGWARRLTGDPQFSIVIATLNPGPKLQGTLDSVLSQNGVTFEVLLIDGGSRDGTLDRIRATKGPVQLVAEPEPGVYVAMNRGLLEAKGEIIHFLGAGDRLRSGMLSRVAAAWPGQPHTLLYGNVWMEDLGILYDGEFDKEKLRRTNICHQAMFYSRRIFRRHGNFDQRYKILADYDLNLKIFGDTLTTIKYIPDIIADYEGNGLSAGTRDEVFQAEKKQLCELRLGPKPKNRRS